jgi:hypothetical protein
MEKAHMAFDILNEIKMITIFYSVRWKCRFDFFVKCQKPLPLLLLLPIKVLFILSEQE